MSTSSGFGGGKKTGVVFSGGSGAGAAGSAVAATVTGGVLLGGAVLVYAAKKLYDHFYFPRGQRGDDIKTVVLPPSSSTSQVRFQKCCTPTLRRV